MEGGFFGVLPIVLSPAEGNEGPANEQHQGSCIKGRDRAQLQHLHQGMAQQPCHYSYQTVAHKDCLGECASQPVAIIASLQNNGVNVEQTVCTVFSTVVSSPSPLRPVCAVSCSTCIEWVIDLIEHDCSASNVDARRDGRWRDSALPILSVQVKDKYTWQLYPD